MSAPKPSDRAPIRVLQIQNNYTNDMSNLGEQIIRGLLEESSTDNFVVTAAFLKKRPKANDPVSCADESVYFDFTNNQLKGLRRFVSLYRLYRYCKSKQFDVVICHRFKPTHIILILNALLSFKRCISVTHGIGDFDRSYRQRVVKRWLRSNWTFVGVSSSVTDYLQQKCSVLTSANTVTINNAIDIEKAKSVQLTREQARQHFHLESDRFIFGTIGRLVPVKGHSYLIEAAAKLKDRYPNFAVVIIGGGREEQALREQIQQAGVEQQVILAGWQDNALQYVQAFDVFVLPSLSEGLPISLLEAMSGAIPTIGSDIPAIRPVIEGLGLLAKPEDSDSLAQVMESYLIMDLTERKRLGDAHLQRLQERHNIADYRNHYRRLITTS